jgi:hypothetical protein
MTNFYKQAVAFLTLVAILYAMWTFDAVFYAAVMTALGGWQTGTWFNEWAENRWPTKA